MWPSSSGRNFEQFYFISKVEENIQDLESLSKTVLQNKFIKV